MNETPEGPCVLLEKELISFLYYQNIDGVLIYKGVDFAKENGNYIYHEYNSVDKKNRVEA